MDDPQANQLEGAERPSVTLADYERALEAFLEDMRPISGSVASVLLFGSMVRGTVRPGLSDVLDAHVFLREEVFAGREQFKEALAVMVEASRRLRRTGLPGHPFFYSNWDDKDHFPAMYLGFWQARECSRVIFGRDVRGEIASSARSSEAARATFYEARRVAHPLTRYLREDTLSEVDCEEIVHTLTTVNKHIPRIACLALDIWTKESEEVRELEQALPGLDTSVLRQIAEFRVQPPARQKVAAWQEMIARTVEFVEEVHDRIAAHPRAAARASLSSAPAQT